VDFAYRIHTEVGHSCVGAKVNGKLVPLTYVFKTGDLVEILTSKASHGPSLDWLSFVATSAAKSRIKAWFRRQHREENVRQGRHLLEAECKRLSLSPSEVLTEAALRAVAEKQNYADIEELLAAVGLGEISAEAVLRRITGKVQAPAAAAAQAPARQGTMQLGISAPGAEGILFRLSCCCCPVPGDAIVGYVTRGRGVTVHRADCSNIALYRKREPERLIEVQWSLSQQAFYPVQIEIEALDRVGLLNDITAIISASNTNIRSLKLRTNKTQLALFSLVIDIPDLEHLNKLLHEIAALPDVLRAYRLKSA
jgi:GTP pyrophosphokinase